MAVDAILSRHCIMPGQIHASPVFDNASRALQRLSLDNDATTAIAAGDAQAMEQVLEMAVRLNNQVVGRRLQVASLHGLTAFRRSWVQTLCYIHQLIVQAELIVPF